MISPQTSNQPGFNLAETSAGSSPLEHAAQLLGKDKVTHLLEQAPDAFGTLRTKVVGQYQRLSTTQKVVGGLVLVLGLRQLLRGGKGKKHKQHGKRSSSDKAQAGALHELLHFVNDRIEGYKRAVAHTPNAQPRGYYQQLVSQSQQFSRELNDHLRRQGSGPEASTTLKGKLYRAWMDAKATVTGDDEAAILAANIFGEEWALKAYEDALSSGKLNGPVRNEVTRQYAQSKKTHQELLLMQGK